MFPGVAYFPSGIKVGTANASLGDAQSPANGIETKVISMDTFIVENGITEIDLITIDAEGYDARVILGMLKSLVKIRVHFLEFEYHSVGKWATTDLSMILNILEVLDFNCFWEGNAGELWRGTGCWHPLHGIRKYWSNLICVNSVLQPDADRSFMDATKKYMVPKTQRNRK